MPSQEQSRVQSQERGREQAGASVSRPPSGRPKIPGAWLAALVAAMSAGLFGFWVRTNDARTAEAGSGNARIADVAPGEIDAALGTVNGSPEQLDRFRARQGCERHLAWITVMRAPGQPPGRIRLQSGGYVSPTFDLAETPVRVALPYPAPYRTGHGTLAVVGTTADAIIALTPPQPVPAQPGPHRIDVRWNPSAECATR